VVSTFRFSFSLSGGEHLQVFLFPQVAGEEGCGCGGIQGDELVVRDQIGSQLTDDFLGDEVLLFAHGEGDVIAGVFDQFGTAVKAAHQPLLFQQVQIAPDR